VQRDWNSRQVAGVIIHPKTGEIYAMGVYPTFDLNNFSGEGDPAVFSNPLVEGVFELGSIIKPLTMAAGLDSGAVTRESTYEDRGRITLDGYTISNFDGKARGRVSMQEVLNQSLNTGAAHVAAKMGSDKFREYFLERYRIGQETGIDLPNESAGLVSNLDNPRDVEYATASFGQGIAMTPMAAVRALSTLANGGTLVTPHVGSEIRYETGLRKKISFKEGERVLSRETSEEITRMLVEVVDKALLDGTVALPNYSIAAKTGTAQIASPSGGYYDDRFLHSFFGYFPAYDAQFLIFFYNLEPKEVRYASQTLTHPFIDTVDFLINYYDVPPDR
jgi:cell division protein FtsI/penicillin-binding protein 2